MQPGISGRAARFGEGIGITIDAFRTVAWGDTWSISFWFQRQGGFNSYAPLLNTGYVDPSTWDIQVGREQGGSTLYASVATVRHRAGADFGPVAVTPRRWHHVCLIYNRGAIELVVNGSVVRSRLADHGAVIHRQLPLQIGVGLWNNTPVHFIGLIDEVRIYDRALIGAEINRLGAEMLESSEVPVSERPEMARLAAGYQLYPPTVASAVAEVIGAHSGPAPTTPVASPPPASSPPPSGGRIGEQGTKSVWWTDLAKEPVPEDLADGELARTWLRLWREGQKQVVIDDLERRSRQTP